MMSHVDVNWLIVLSGVVISMVLGYIWYSPAVLGKVWMKETGKKEMQGQATSYIYMIIASAVLTYALIYFASYAGATTTGAGAAVGFWLWLGFSAASGVGRSVFRGDSFKLYAIDYGYTLVQFVLIGMVVGGWR